jgi:hypothetical protein
MVYDYLAGVPKENPLAWAENYYLHYPKVAIGQWPPGYHVMEALWSLVWGRPEPPPSGVAGAATAAGIEGTRYESDGEMIPDRVYCR